jgi:hypothetical protein
VFLLLTVLAASGCSLVEPSQVDVASPQVACDPMQIDPPPVLQCEAAVRAALETIDQSGIVAAATFHYGPPCAPNMRCPFGSAEVGYVVVQLVDGRCAYSSVAVEPVEVFPPSISASVLEAWPPSEWPDMGVSPPVECR